MWHWVPSTAVAVASRLKGSTLAVKPLNGPLGIFTCGKAPFVMFCVVRIAVKVGVSSATVGAGLKAKPSAVNSDGGESAILASCVEVGRDVLANSVLKSPVIFSIPAAAA